ncbi:MAG: orc1/cdc6 family replication initiation protein [Nitrososphaerales archaeon]|nr:orc1/cdc6 family replication initiation protein [Nitrososphaerales archaeon]
MESSSSKDILDEIFSKAIMGRTLFKNPEALRSDYVPDKLLFRERQITSVAEVLAPILHGSRCSNLFLYGKTGTGKTAVSKYVLKRLEEKALSIGVPVKFSYCNTRILGTEYRVLSEIARSIQLEIPFTGLALGEVFERILKRIDNSKLGVVIVLDEIDFLVKNFGDNLLYEFTRANERLEHGFITIVGISNDLKFKEFLDPRVLSSLSEEEVVFPPYTAEELKAILQDRAEVAFFKDAISTTAINLCAALAASEHGDARRALDLLRVAGEVAEREGASCVEEKHVRIAVQKIEQDRVVEVLRSLPLHDKLVLLAVAVSGPANSTGEVYQRYLALCRKIDLEPLTQRRVSGLLSGLDVLGLVSAATVSRGRYGRTKKISLLIPNQLIRDVFQEDPTVNALI